MNPADAQRLNAIRQRTILFRWWMLAGLTLAVLSASTLLEIPLVLAPLLAVLLVSLSAKNYLLESAPRSFWEADAER